MLAKKEKSHLDPDEDKIPRNQAALSKNRTVLTGWRPVQGVWHR
jgi:hypothetical protein